ncbi:MAG: carbohydrate kinase [Sedimentitalea sp.]
MILCCGEALVDMIPAETTNGATGFVPHVGGSVLNTAVALGRLGSKVDLMTGLSSDQFGQRIEAALSASNVGATLSVRSARPTTLAFVHLVDRHATYNFYDENSALSGIVADDLPALPDALKAAFFGGISLCNAPLGDALADLAAQCAGATTVMYDPNIRPGFAHNEAAYRDRLTAMIGHADIIKVSQDDLDWLLPGADASTLIEMGAGLVLLTSGSEGAQAWHRNGATARVGSVPVDVIDTVGAGDTFNAGVLHRADALGLLDPTAREAMTSEHLHDLLSFGARAAAITVSRAGANPPWASDL